jgi:hypothetical protein
MSRHVYAHDAAGSLASYGSPYAFLPGMIVTVTVQIGYLNSVQQPAASCSLWVLLLLLPVLLL